MILNHFIMFRNSIALLLIAYLVHHVSHAHIIIIHGSFAKQESWYRSGGDFYETVHTLAIPLHQQVRSFSWSGIPFYAPMMHGAKQLMHMILSLTDTMPLILIGHSHGGNIINLTSQLLFTYFWDISLTSSFDNSTHLAMSIDHPLDSFDFTHTLPRQPVSLWSTPPTPLTPIISQAILLGTPVDMRYYWPHMEMIDRLILFYSQADYVQTIAKSYQRTYPDHPRKQMINTKFRDGSQYYAPSHSQLHHSGIATTLFSFLSSEHTISVTAAIACIT